MYDVADLAGVSTATVSRVIHGSPLVHPDTQQRVRAAIDQLGFVPDGSAQGLSRRRKDIIGLAALERGTDETDIEQAGQLFVDEIVHAVESVLRGTDCSLLLTFGQAGEQFQRRWWPGSPRGSTPATVRSQRRNALPALVASLIFLVRRHQEDEGCPRRADVLPRRLT